MKSLEIDWRESDVSIDDVDGRTLQATTEVNGQLLSVVVADGNTSGRRKPTVIWPQAFMARAFDPIEVYRTQVLAKQLNTRVVSVDRPGVRYDPYLGSETEAGRSNIGNILKAATAGNLDDASAVQLAALDNILEFKNGEELHLLGYSFGAWSASSMASVLSKEPFGSVRHPIVSGITFIEAVNDQDSSLNDLRVGLAKDSSTKNVSRYLRHNEILGASEALFFDWKSAAERSPEGTDIHSALDRRQALSLFLPAFGLRKGFTDRLAAVVATGELDDTKITFVRANGSLIARRDAHAQSMSTLNAAQKNSTISELVELLPPPNELPNSHPLVHSMGVTAVLSQRLLAKLPDMGQ